MFFTATVRALFHRPESSISSASLTKRFRPITSTTTHRVKIYSFAFCVLFFPLKSIAEPLTWSASKDGLHYTLFGTVHVGEPRMHPLPEQIQQYLISSDGLILEADISGGSASVMPNTALTTREVLSRKQQQKLTEVADYLGLHVTSLWTLPPWQTAVVLQLHQATKIGLTPQLGIDHTLSQIALDNAIPIMELESIDAQLTMLSSLPNEGATLLSHTLTHFDELLNQLPCMIEAWIAGDETAFTQLLHYSEIDDKTDRALIYDRNYAWRDALESRFDDGNYVVAVGTFHLVGEHGLPALLEQAGFTVNKMNTYQPTECLTQ